MTDDGDGDISIWLHDEHIRLHHRYQAALAAYEKPVSVLDPPAKDPTLLNRAVNEARAQLRAFEEEYGLNVRN